MTKIGFVSSGADRDDRDGPAATAFTARLLFGVATGANGTGSCQGLRGSLPTAVDTDSHDWDSADDPSKSANTDLYG